MTRTHPQNPFRRISEHRSFFISTILILVTTLLLLSGCRGTGTRRTAQVIRKTVTNTVVITKANATRTPAATDEPTITATAQPTATATLPSQQLSAASWREWPVIATTTNRARQIYQQGLAAGLNPRHFSRLGEEQFMEDRFMGMFDRYKSYYIPPENADLRDAVDQFNGSFARDGFAVQQEFNALGALSPLWALPDICQAGETPLACEIRVHKPSILLINLKGYWDGRTQDTYAKAMRTIIDYSISKGVVPILSTVYSDLAGSDDLNMTIASLALEYDLPLWNLWRASEEARLRSTVDPYPLDQSPIAKIWEARSFSGLQTLDSIWRGLSDLNIVATARVTQDLQSLVQTQISILTTEQVYSGTSIKLYEPLPTATPSVTPTPANTATSVLRTVTKTPTAKSTSKADVTSTPATKKGTPVAGSGTPVSTLVEAVFPTSTQTATLTLTATTVPSATKTVTKATTATITSTPTKKPSPSVTPTVITSLLSGQLLFNLEERNGDTAIQSGVYAWDILGGKKEQIAEAGSLLQDVSTDGKYWLISQKAALYLVDSKTREKQQITDTLYQNTRQAAIFSQDGRTIFYILDKSARSWIVRYNLDGSGWKNISREDDDPVLLYRNSDLNQIYWENGACRGYMDCDWYGIWTMNLTTLRREYLMNGNRPKISPSGGGYAFNKLNEAEEHYLVYATLDNKQLTDLKNLGDLVMDFAWSNDGSKLAIVSQVRQGNQAETFSARPITLEPLNHFSAKLFPLTTGMDVQLAWSPAANAIALLGTKPDAKGYHLSLQILDNARETYTNLDSELGLSSSNFLYSANVWWVAGQ